MLLLVQQELQISLLLLFLSLYTSVDSSHSFYQLLVRVNHYLEVLIAIATSKLLLSLVIDGWLNVLLVIILITLIRL